MPSNIDKKFIDSLNDFTKALEDIVALMEQQQKEKGGDVVNSLLASMDSNLGLITTKMEELLEISKDTNKKQDEILNQIKASRKQKEAGMFDKIENKENKSKIVSGIDTVILIAGGVLAIGLAFKVIGQVDFLSVVSLSLGILMVSKSFSEIAKIENLTPTKTAMVGLALIAIAGALTISSFILRSFKVLTVPQMMSMVIASAAIGASAFFIFKAVKELQMKPTDMWKYLLLPIILPAIAAGLTVSSWFLRSLSPMTIMQGVSAIFVGLALAAGAFAVSLVIKGLKDKDGKIDIKSVGLALLLLPGIAIGLALSSIFLKGLQPISINQAISAIAIGLALSAGAFAIMLVVKGLKGKDGQIDLKNVGMALLILPSIALGLVLASVAFLGFQAIKNPVGVIMGSLAMGLSILFFLPAVYVLGKMSMKDMASGVLGVVMVAGAITATSLILNLGKYDGNTPSIMWSVGVGLSLIAFSIPVWFLGKTMGIKEMLIGSLAVVILSTAIMTTSWILSIGNYKNYPDWKWALGVGLSLIMFSPAVILFGILAMTGIGALALVAGSALTLVVASAIVGTSFILSKGKYDAYPSLDWALGAGLALVGFGAGMVALGLIPFAGLILEKGTERMLMVANAIKEASLILAGGNYTGGPTEDWAKGVGLSLSAFAYALSVSSETSLFSKKIDTNAFGNFMVSVADAMIKVSDVLRSGKWDGSFPSKDWGEGVSASLTPFINAYEAINNRSIFKKGGSNAGFGELMVSIANAMIQVADILRNGVWVGGPPKEWSDGVGSAITAFVTIMRDNKSSDVRQSKRLLPDVAESMVEVANILKGVDWTGVPSKEWATIVGDTISMFVKIMKDNAAGDVRQSKKLLPDLAQSMVDVADVFRGVDWGEAPRLDWATNVSEFTKSFQGIDLNDIPSEKMIDKFGASISSFVNIIDNDKLKKINPSDKVLQNLAQSMVEVSNILSTSTFPNNPTDSWISKISNLFDVVVNKVPDKNQLKKLQDFIAVLKEFSNAADKIKDSGIDKLNKLTTSVTIMSVIDDQRLQSVIRVLDNNKDAISNSISASGRDGAQIQTNKQSTTEISRVDTKTSSFGKDKQDSMIDEMKSINKKFDDLLEFVVQQQAPANTGKEDTTK